MCELFAASMRHASRVTMSFETFAERGGHSAKHRDGWGIAFYEGSDCSITREPSPAAESALAHAMRTVGMRSHLVISHIRYATRGSVGLRNTHPFARELGGRVHTFAHNGNLSGSQQHPGLGLGFARPIGETDSEYVFCCLLAELAPLWNDGAQSDLPARVAVVRQFAAKLRSLGPANFIYSDAEFLYAHGDRRTQSNGFIEPPGLWTLHRECGDDPDALYTPGLHIEPHPQQRVTLVASVPLSQERWRPLDEGEVLVLRAGIAV